MTVVSNSSPVTGFQAPSTNWIPQPPMGTVAILPSGSQMVTAARRGSRLCQYFEFEPTRQKRCLHPPKGHC